MSVPSRPAPPTRPTAVRRRRVGLRASLVVLLTASALIGPRPGAAVAATAPSVPVLDLSVIANTAGAAGTAPTDPAAGPAAAAKLVGSVNDVAVGAGGVVYVANGNRVVRLDPQADGSYDLVRLIGTGAPDTTVVPETGAVAATTGFGTVSHVAVAPDGRLYFVSVITDRASAYGVFRLETDGTVTRVILAGAEVFDIAVAPSGSLFMLRVNGTGRFDAPVTASDTPPCWCRARTGRRR